MNDSISWGLSRKPSRLRRITSTGLMCITLEQLRIEAFANCQAFRLACEGMRGGLADVSKRASDAEITSFHTFTISEAGHVFACVICSAVGRIVAMIGAHDHKIAGSQFLFK